VLHHGAWQGRNNFAGLTVIKATNEFDVFLGVRLRQARLGLSQEQLGDFLGVTFQQVQKYEKGTNRITVSRLERMIEALGVSLDDLVDVEPPGISAPEPETSRLLRLFSGMSSPMRERVLQIVKLAVAND
jgi:transcriptional regulator with XRE-family HTH domain